MGMIGNTLAQGLISGANIQDGTVDTPDLKDSAVTTAKVADGAVTNAKINDVAASKVTGTVGTSQIADGAVTAAKLSETAIRDKLGFTPSNLSGRNKIVNGAMSVKQRAPVSLTNLTGYNNRVVDFHRTGGGNQTTGRHSIYLKNGISPASGIYEAGAAPAGFGYSLKYVVDVAEGDSTGSVLFHSTFVEGYNMADLGYGTANAQTATLSFWVKSSAVGKYEIQMHNNISPQCMNRLAYTISSANTWERKTIVVAPPTIGTWANGEDCGIRFDWKLKQDTSPSATTPENTWTTTELNAQLPGTVSWFSTAGATFYITGIQFEAGSIATPFEHRPYGQELALCQRYYVEEPYTGEGSPVNFNGGYVWNTSVYKWFQTRYPVPMRTMPAVVLASGAGAGFDGKARFVVSGDSSAGVDVAPYSVEPNLSTKYFVVKSYNEVNAYSVRGICAGYKASAEF